MAVFSGNGSNTAPSFTFSSDTDTGMYRFGSDALGLTTGGTRRLLINSSYATFTGGSVVPLLVEATAGAGSAEVTRLQRSNGADTHYLSTSVDADANLVDFLSTGTSAGGFKLRSNTATALETNGSGNIATGGVAVSGDAFRQSGSNSLDGTSVAGGSITLGAAPGTFTVEVLCGTGVTLFTFGTINSALNASTALAILHGGITSTNNQSTLATITNSGTIPASSITKISGGFSFDLTISSGLGSSLIWSAFGTGAAATTVSII